MLLDLASQGSLTKYRLLSNTITPRPIAWISTISPSGTSNLAPFSFFGVVSSNPAVFSLCLSTKSDGSPKDTLQNLLSTRKATINLIEKHLLPLLEKSASELPYDTSEASTFAIPLQALNPEYPPVVSGVKVAYFCDFVGSKSFGGVDTSIFLEAKSCFVADTLYREDLRLLPAHIGRVGKGYITCEKILPP